MQDGIELARHVDVLGHILIDEEEVRLAEEVLYPLNRIGDQHPAELQNGVVRTSLGFREGYRALAQMLGPGPSSVKSADREIPGPAGRIPLRIYTPAQAKQLLGKVKDVFEISGIYDFDYDIDEPREFDNDLTDALFVLKRR